MFSGLDILNKFVFQVCGIDLENIQQEVESQKYFAHTFELNKIKVKFRMAKITPTKSGQFVTIWKRNRNGITEPYNVSDDYELYLIGTRQESKIGFFIFNKNVLSENKILSNNETTGKRGIRVYPSWSLTQNNQAKKTQNWQTKYFVEIKADNEIDINRVKKLLRVEKK